MWWRMSMLVAVWLCITLHTGATDSLLWQRGGMRVQHLRARRGFRITTADPVHPRLLAYAPEGDWEKAVQHPVVRWIMAQYERGVRPTGPVIRMTDCPTRVEPLLTDRWHQFAPYNSLTPLIDGQHCATGCVAHAMAQVIRYHRFAACQGSHTYVDSLGCGQTLTALFPPEGYRFDQMLDTYDDGRRYTAQELEAVCQLLSHCGIAVDMTYGVASSSAQSALQPVALSTWFGYDEGMQLLYRDYYRTIEWDDMLRRELAAGRPVLMSAHSPSLGHAFCCDGYDENGLFHLNLGMGGEADGYYFLPHLTPKQPEWYDPDEAEGGMNLLQYITIGIQPALPDSHRAPRRHALALDRLEAMSDSCKRDEARVAVRQLTNVGWNHYEGTVALWMEKDGTLLTPVASCPMSLPPTYRQDTTFSDTLPLLIPQSLPEGHYRLVPCFQEEDGEWQEVRTSIGTPNYLLAHLHGQDLRLKPDTAAWATLQLQEYFFPDTITCNTRPRFSFTLKNGDTPFCGRFYVLMQPTEDPERMHCIQYQGLYLEPGETTTRLFQRTRIPLAAGRYSLRLGYEATLLTDTILWMTPEPVKEVEVVAGESTILPVTATGSSAQDARYDLNGRRLPPHSHHKGVCLRRKDGLYKKTISQTE